MKPRYYIGLVAILAAVASIIMLYKARAADDGVGIVLGSYKGVEVYYNGASYSRNHGRNYSEDGYYYGYKWQCVEYIKRFYYLSKDHRMPDVYGHAKDFFDVTVEHGMLNPKRGLIQYKNGENEKPAVDDILVFNDTSYGHIVIITEVGTDYITVVQQNMGASPYDRFELRFSNGKYYVGRKRIPAGFLRKG